MQIKAEDGQRGALTPASTECVWRSAVVVAVSQSVSQPVMRYACEVAPSPVPLPAAAFAAHVSAEAVYSYS